jgi:N-acetylglucosamine PTS system EIICBA or EIICB component
MVYYGVFSFLIKRLNVLTPGREPEADADDAGQRERATVAPSPEPGPPPRDQTTPEGGAAPA